MTDKKKRGFHEDVDPLLGKARKHSIIALKNKFDKEKISKEVAITPANNELEEKTLNLHFKDSNKFLDAVFEFEEKHDTTIPLDFEEDRFVVSISKELVDMFRNYMKDKGLQEIPDATEVDDKITRVENERSNGVISKDKMKTGNNENTTHLNAWVKNPGKSDLAGVDTLEAK